MEISSKKVKILINVQIIPELCPLWIKYNSEALTPDYHVKQYNPSCFNPVWLYLIGYT